MENVFVRDARDEILHEAECRVVRFLVNVKVAYEVDKRQEERR